MFQLFLHYSLHLIFPLALALFFFRKHWRQAYLIMLATMLVDLDHLLADPVFAANRCSIGFHPLHSSYAMAVYGFLLFLPRYYRMAGIGLLFHMLTDLIDCLMSYSKCPDCLQDAPARELLETLRELWF